MTTSALGPKTSTLPLRALGPVPVTSLTMRRACALAVPPNSTLGLICPANADVPAPPVAALLSTTPAPPTLNWENRLCDTPELLLGVMCTTAAPLGAVSTLGLRPAAALGSATSCATALPGSSEPAAVSIAGVASCAMRSSTARATCVTGVRRSIILCSL